MQWGSVIQWGDDDQTFIYSHVADQWNWTHVEPGLKHIKRMAASVSQPVSWIIYLAPEFRLPPGGFTDAVKQFVRTFDVMDVEACIFVCATQAPLDMILTGLKLYLPDDPHLHLVSTIDDALDIIDVDPEDTTFSNPACR